jgi:hypothetical protein
MYTPYHSLHCVCTYHTNVFSLRTHTTPPSSLAAYKHTVFTVYLHSRPLSSQSTYTPDHCLHSPRTHHNSVFTICFKKHTHTHTHIHRIHILRTHHNTVFTLTYNDVQSPYDSEHGRGGLVWVSTIFSFLLTRKIGADKAAPNLVTPKTIFRTE